MEKNEFTELSEQEQKIVDLGNNEDFKKNISEMQNTHMTDDERVKKIKSILSEKGIEYTDEDAELFNSLINYANEKKIKLGSTELGGISGGADEKINYQDLPEDVQEKIFQKTALGRKRARLITLAVMGVTFLGGLGAGFGIGRWYQKNKG